jgi:hypothetical protein
MPRIIPNSVLLSKRLASSSDCAVSESNALASEKGATGVVTAASTPATSAILVVDSPPSTTPPGAGDVLSSGHVVPTIVVTAGATVVIEGSRTKVVNGVIMVAPGANGVVATAGVVITGSGVV